MLILKLLSFQTCQRTQTHVYDCLGLGLRKLETFFQSFFCYLCILAAADNGDHFINKVQRFQKSL